MSTRRITSLYGNKCTENLERFGKYNDRYSIAHNMITSLPITYDKPARAHFNDNDTCLLCAPLNFNGDDNYEFKDLNSFEVEERGHWFINRCKSCESIVNFPTKLEKCFICDTGEFEHRSRTLGKLTRNAKELSSTYDVNPEMLARAQQDLADNPVPGTNEAGVDWDYLKENLD